MKVYFAAAEGVPDNSPVEESVNPGGSWPPVVDHEYGRVPPEASSVPEYVTPTAPFPRGDEPVIVSGFTTSTVNARVAVCAGAPASLARAVKLKLPAVNGLPLSTPAELNVRPGGNIPDAKDQEYGVVPPLALSVCAYALPTVPEGRGLLESIVRIVAILIDNALEIV